MMDNDDGNLEDYFLSTDNSAVYKTDKIKRSNIFLLELLDIDRFSIPGETETKQFVGKLSQQHKKGNNNKSST